MTTVRLASETDFAGWRDAARRLRLAGVPPEAASWRTGADTGLLDDDAPLPEPPPGAGFSAPREFLDLAELVILNRAQDRFDRLYRLLWRLKDEPNLMHIATDDAVAAALKMRIQVTQAIHKMHAFVRFRRVETPGDPAAPETYAAWFEPPHRVVERGAAYFVKRLANMRFSILSPDACVHWDGAHLATTPGLADRPPADDDAFEEHWRTYYASVFNPARLNAKVMAQHMPRAYWRNLPEAQLIPTLTRDAQARTTAMVHAAPTAPSPRAMRAAARASRDAPIDSGVAPASLEEIAASVQVCRRCELWRDATQGVPGQGPSQARLMLVGEQPGDQEDLAGHPFVGPAGQMLDRALAQAGVPRGQAYVTNAVKHFKHELRGKRRIHQTPRAGEVKACKWWLDNERRLVRPKVVVALGSTAAGALLGRSVAVMRERGPVEALPDGAKAFVTVHPSMLLRIPDPAAKEAAYRDFVRDLRAAWSLVEAA